MPQPDLVNTAWRDYGNRVGAFRLLDAARRLRRSRPRSCSTPTLYDTAPAVTDAAARAAGAEMVGARPLELGLARRASTPGASGAYLEAVAARIAAEEGARPGGWSSPWLDAHRATRPTCSPPPATATCWTCASTTSPCGCATAAAPLLAIPYALELNDSTSMIGRQVSARRLRRHDRRRVRRAAGAPPPTQPLVMSVVVHSFISGVPFRLRQLARALAPHRRRTPTRSGSTQPRHDPRGLRRRCAHAAGRRPMTTADGRRAAGRRDRRDRGPHGLALRRDGRYHEVLRGVDLSIEPGEILGPGRRVRLREERAGAEPDGAAARGVRSRGSAGRRGSPASTCCTAAPPQQRTVRRGELGVIFQDPMTSLNPTMRVGRQITETGQDEAEGDPAADRGRRLRTGDCGCGSIPHQLSGGLRQRVMAAIAIVRQPVAGHRRRAHDRARRDRAGPAPDAAARAPRRVRLRHPVHHPRPRRRRPDHRPRSP